ncbi:hypothetical protein Hanom_Chr15g01386291 [Helianthus anomalus]
MHQPTPNLKVEEKGGDAARKTMYKWGLIRACVHIKNFLSHLRCGICCGKRNIP